MIKPKIGTMNANLPLTDGAWNVTAQADGMIQAGGKRVQSIQFDYMSRVNGLANGYVVSQIELRPTLEQYAKQLGLNKIETDEFVPFWLGKLKGSPYVQISHFSRVASDKIVNLDISPKPDTYVPIVMYFKRLDMPKIMAKPIFEPIQQRIGFTAVEWSGIIE